MEQSCRFKKHFLSTCIAAITFGAPSAMVNAQEEGLIDEIVVTGIRSSLIRSVDVKRNALSIVDAISAEDIGKLPDTTIADSLQRVTGIQIRRNAGEGSTVNVRGMPQVSTLLNGEQFLSAGSITTSQPDFTDVPAELLSRVDVIKSSEASTLAGGVAGTIDLKTRRPLDLEGGWTFAGSAEASAGSYTEDAGGKVTGFAGFSNDDNFGALLSVSGSQASLANYRYGMFTDWWFRGYQEDGSSGQGWNPPTDITGDGDTNDALFGTIDYGITDKTSERDRIGVSTSVQFRVNDAVELIGDVFYTAMDQSDHTNGLIADNAWSQYDWVYPVNPVNRGASADGNTQKDFYTASVLDLQALRVKSKAEAQVNDRESLNINLQANIDFNDQFSLSTRYIHGEAENKHTANYADAFITTGEQHDLYSRTNNITTPVNPGGEGPGRISIRGDMSGEHPSFSYPQNFGQDINSYGLVSSFSHQNRDEESQLDVLRFDGTFEFEEGGSVEFGYRYGDRKVTRYQYDYAAPFTRRGYDDQSVTVYSKWKDAGLPINGIPDQGIYGDSIARTIPFTELNALGWIHQVDDFGPASDGNAYYFIKPEIMEDALGFQETLYPGNVAIKDPGTSYVVDDTSHTIYLQGNIEGELGIPYEANFGVQWVHNFLDITQYAFNATDLQVTVDGNTYTALNGTPTPELGEIRIERHATDVLPRFNIAFETSENTRLRFAYTQTMTQLDANDLGLGLVYTTNNVPSLGVFRAFDASQDGNPYMKPWRAENLDLSLEWYFSDSGIVSLGLYRLDVETAITTRLTTTAALADDDGVMRDEDGLIDQR